MALRESIQNNPTIVGAIAIAVLLVVAAVWMFDGQPATGRFYYDLTSGEIVVEDIDGAMPPVTLASGNQGVLAHQFACGDCDGGDRFIGYLEKYTDAYKQAMSVDPVASGEPVRVSPRGRLVAAPPEDGGEPQWADAMTLQGTQITSTPRQRCGSARPTECVPQ